jgi:hypothetical protein
MEVPQKCTKQNNKKELITKPSILKKKKNLCSLFTTPLHLDSCVSRQNNIKNPSQNFIHLEKTYTICLQHHWI